MSLNDPQWGRGSTDKESKKESDGQEVKEPQKDQNQSDQEQKSSGFSSSRNNKDGDDLERLWDEFNRALGNMLGQGPQGTRKQDNDWNSKAESRSEGESKDSHSTNNAEVEFQKVMKRFKQMGGAGAHQPRSNGKGLLFAGVLAAVLWGGTGFYLSLIHI